MLLSNMIDTLIGLRSKHGDCEVLCGNAEIAGFAVHPKNASGTIVILTRPKGTGPATMSFGKPPWL